MKNLNEIIILYNNGCSIRQISNILHINRKTISKVLKNNNIEIRMQNITSKKYFCNENYFEEINNQDKAYWLGFIMADGFIESKRKYGNQKLGITLSSYDENHLILFNKCLDSNYPIKRYIGSGYKKDGEYSKILITSQKLVDDIKKWNIIENKTKICNFPFQIPKNFYIDFIRGYLDGDGSIYFDKTTKQYRICFVGTKNIIESINLILNKSNKLTNVKPNLYEVKYGGNKNVYKILNKLYENKNIKLERKYNLYLELKKYIKR